VIHDLDAYHLTTSGVFFPVVQVAWWALKPSSPWRPVRLTQAAHTATSHNSSIISVSSGGHVDSHTVYAFVNRVLRTGDESEEVLGFLEELLPNLVDTVAGSSVIVAKTDQGHWQLVTQVGSHVAMPMELLAESLDQLRPISSLPWTVIPVTLQNRSHLFFAFREPPTSDPELVQQCLARLRMIADAVPSLDRRSRMARRIRRLEAIGDIVAGWNTTFDMNELLHRVAETSTELLNAERASIFLWDRAGQRLVGRPALGVDQEELILDDERGVVGSVVQTGQTRRVNRDDQANDIDRSVDEQLQFQTHSLLCVPLRVRDGRILGAFEMINKVQGNFTAEDETALIELAEHASRALENSQEYNRLLESRRQIAKAAAQHVRLIGESASTQKLREDIQRVGPTDLAVLVLGENGTGKEVASQLIHYLSARHDEPFVAVNCAALSETLLASELFGHEKGAFTDAHDTKAGKFELASGGTLLLDEIGDLSAAGQAKLLRVLEEKTVVRVGGNTPIETNARVIAATNQDLAEMVREKTFREDLFYRLNVVSLEILPLRDRLDDILPLASHFLASFASHANRPAPRLSQRAQTKLLQHRWPGNVRELRNVIERLVYLVPEDTIEPEHITLVDAGRDAIQLDQPLSDATREFQVQYIQQQIAAASGNMTIAADRLGLHRANLYRKMGHLGMNPDNGESET